MSKKKKNSRANRKANEQKQQKMNGAKKERNTAEDKPEKKTTEEETSKRQPSKNAGTGNAVSTKKAEQNEKAGTVTARPAEKLSLYTIFAMLTTLVTSATAVLAMIVTSKPAYYYLDGRFGASLDSVYIDLIRNLVFDEKSEDKLGSLIFAAAFLTIAATVCALVIVVRSIDSLKRPMPVVNIIAFVLSAAALGLFLYGHFYARQIVADSGNVMMDAEDAYFNIYMGCFAAFIANAAINLVNIFTTLTGLLKWKKTGKAY